MQVFFQAAGIAIVALLLNGCETAKSQSQKVSAPDYILVEIMYVTDRTFRFLYLWLERAFILLML